LIGTYLGWIPPSLQQSLAALPFMPQPVMIVNMVCTNVPGPMVPLYANGREVLTYYPHVPCGHDVGFGVAIASYNQNLHYGVTYDMQATPDGELFRDFLIESYQELRDAAGVKPAKPFKVAAKPAAASRPKPAAEDLRAHRAPEPAAQEAATAPPAAQAEPVMEQPSPIVEAPAPSPEPVAATPEPPLAGEAPAVPEGRQPRLPVAESDVNPAPAQISAADGFATAALRQELR
jgi:hypothetical protein